MQTQFQGSASPARPLISSPVNASRSLAPMFGSKEDKADISRKKKDGDETPKRTRLGNLMSLYKDYVVNKRWIGDIIWGTAIGAIMAIGSPLMVATVPPAIATMMGISLAFRTISALALNPESDFMTNLMDQVEARELMNKVKKGAKAKED